MRAPAGTPGPTAIQGTRTVSGFGRQELGLMVKIDLEKLQDDERTRKLGEALEGGEREDSPKDPDSRFIARFPASGSKNWG